MPGYSGNKNLVRSVATRAFSCYLEMADARAAAQALVASGAPLLGEPWELATGWVVECADPWGNVIGLTDYLKAPTKARCVRGSDATGSEM